MKKVDIHETGENKNFWVISVPGEKRDAIHGALCLHDAASTSELHEHKVDEIICHISPRAEDSDKAELRELIERMAGEPEKPERHPILDEHWTVGFDKVLRKDTESRCLVHPEDYLELLSRVPDLVRAVLSHVEAWRGTGHAGIGAILQEMGIDAKCKGDRHTP